ncbi:hypothetical protein BC939DRAFT_504298 [Gamsiella multidivaricata]|uniref:uncharacterized protein n=1 Tax=Gamsiella multidivaricata TaxID=101098 RepID=UPI002220FF20|nr:uncharacterized protein BC939DRAFT_504298 [Gamsiella multidivaricata]KAI7821503.1 hypothetical protein BC939DRAFT_504298 [Gamsiella multidivaricata]
MDFTQCFQDSACLLIFLSPRLHKVLGKGRLDGVKPNAIFYIKMLLVVAAFAIQLGLLIKIVSEDNYVSSSLLSVIVYLIALIGAVVLHWYEYFNMANPSSGLLNFWLFTALISIFPTRSWTQESPDGLSAPIPLLRLLFTIVSFLIFILENIPKSNRSSLIRSNVVVVPQSKPSPEPRANFFTRITFFWLLPLLNLGKKKALRMDDLWSVHPKLLSYPLYLTTKAKMDADEAIRLQKVKDEEAVGSTVKDPKLKKGHMNLLGVVLHTVGYSFVTAAVPRILYIAALYVRPVLFSQLISFVDSYSANAKLGGIVPEVPWVGFGLLIAVFTSATLSTIFDNQFQNICYNSSLRARGVLVNLIYRKSLRLSSTNKQEGMGSIVNHMSTDVDKVVAFFQVIHLSWSAILEIIITIAQLWAQVRYAIFASVGVVLAILFIVGVLSPLIGKSQKAMMERSDHRMKLLSELVNYIKSIKLYAWETYFEKNISKVRLEQLNKLREFYSWICIASVFLNSIAAFSIFATLAVYSGMATPEAPLDIRRIFTTITLINMLEDPVGSISSSISTIVSGKVAYNRLRDFFNSEEVDEDNVLRELSPADSELAYEISNGTFGWYTPEAIQSSIEKSEKEAAQKAKTDADAAKKGKKAQKEEKKEKEEDETFKDERLTAESLGTLGGKDEENEKDRTPTPTSENMRDSMGPVLYDVNLKIKRGSLIAVVGRVGEGKSSLVGALLGEMHRYSGTVRSYGSLAYVSQSAWILNDTVRNNILFGRPYDKERYLNTVRACALVPDFKMLVNGDKTIIGEKGINLSGGQKQRISIARAVYADADVYIFDDPLSAVDAHVDQHIFEHAMTSILATKTRILVTNGVNHLKEVDQIVVIKQGRISQDGHYGDLIKDKEGDLFRLIQESKIVASKRAEETEETLENNAEGSEGSTASDSGDEAFIDAVTGNSEDPVERPEGPVKRPTFRRAKSSKVNEEDFDVDVKDEVDEEILGEGKVGWTVYKFYLSTLGISGLVVFLVVAVAFLVINMYTQIWLQNWGNENKYAQVTGTPPPHSDQWWILTYFAWILSSALALAFTITISMVFMARKASKKLHMAMLGPLMRSPMSFFDITSSGKIINRFAKDIQAVDIDLPLQFLNLLFIAFMAINIFVYCIIATPYFAIIMIPLGVGYYWLGGFFLVSSRELKRLDSAAHSPMYAHFGETLAGLVTIRAFHDADRFAIHATTLLDRSQQTSYLTNATARWLQIMLDFMSVLVLTLVALLAIVQRNSVNSGFFSIVLSQIGVLTVIMSRILSTACQLEASIVSVERVREYARLPSEARDFIPDSKTDEAWPQRGEISFKNYSTRYREGLDLVLREIDLTIKGGERVGIVGRTGAGKSSVTLALFRLIEAAEGSINIDGIDISTLGLHELRSHLTIIPQEPFLFGASIRENLDPFQNHTDAELWAALESASLKPYILTLAEGLSAKIENGGENMSLGQRQLMSLARAMLAKNTRVLCLDEATAAIDIETDNAIQRALRREFVGCTVLTIAHRINTIMDSDRILVLEKGRVAEFDSPQTLLQKKDGIFFSLASQSGNV